MQVQIREGWDVDDTTGKAARGPLPMEAGEVESIVGLFSAEQAGGTAWTADYFNSSLPGRVRQRRGELFAQ